MCGAETGFSCADGGMLLFGFMEEETLTGLITAQYPVRNGGKCVADSTAELHARLFQ